MNYLYTDGGARGNPGPGAMGVVIKDETGNTTYEMGTFLGVCTNNEAEYQALIAGLKEAQAKNIETIECRLDSELVVKQMCGMYKVKNERLQVFHSQANELKKSFKQISFVHIPREKNREADSLVNKVLDSMLPSL